MIDTLIWVLVTLGPWFIAVISMGIATFIFLRIYKSGLWGFVKAGPGSQIVLVKDTDGIGKFYKGQYNPDDSTINPDRDDFEPFYVPGEHSSINIGGRSVFVAYRGLGAVQNLEAAGAALMAKKYDIGSKAFNNLINGNYQKDEQGNILVEDGDGTIKKLGGIAISLANAADYAPFNIKSEFAGAIRAGAFKMAMEKARTTDWAKWVGIISTLLIVAAFAITIVMSVQTGGGAPSVSMP